MTSGWPRIDRPATGSLEHRSELGAGSGRSAHLRRETHAARAATEMMCDERGERPRRLTRGLLESTGVGRPVGAVGGKGGLRAGPPPALELDERCAGPDGEREGRGV